MPFLTVAQLITELQLIPGDTLVTCPILAADDTNVVIAQGDVQGVDWNGDCAVLFVQDKAIGEGT